MGVRLTNNENTIIFCRSKFAKIAFEYLFTTAENAINKWKKQNKSQTYSFDKVKTIDELIKSLEKNHKDGTPFTYANEESKLKWYFVKITERVKRNKLWVWKEKTHLAFYDPQLVERMKISNRWNTDCTYKFKADLLGVYQLLTVMGKINTQVCGCIVKFNW